MRVRPKPQEKLESTTSPFGEYVMEIEKQPEDFTGGMWIEKTRRKKS